MAVKDWSTTASSNTAIDGINVNEGCPPSNINNAIRALMASVVQGDWGAAAIKLDNIAESTAAAGVTIDGVTLKDGAIAGYLQFIPTAGIAADGSTDDTAAVQAAIDAAVTAGGGRVILPPGTIRITAPLTHNSATPITLQGAHRRTTTLTADGNFSAILNLQSLSVGVTVLDVDFNAGSTTTKCVDIDSGAVDMTFERCKFRGSTASSVLLFSEGDFLELINSHFVVSNATLVACELDGNNQAAKLRGCRFSGTGRGLKTSATSSDVEGLRVVDTHFVNTGSWNVTLGGSLDTAFVGCSFDQASVSGVIVATDADRVSFTNCWFGAPSGNTTATLLDFNADCGSQMIVTGCRFNLGGKAIHARATATAGEYLRELVVQGCMFNGHDSTCLQLDSVLQCSIIGNTDNGTPTNGSWITQATNAVNGEYTFDGNHWHTQAPTVFATAASYRWGLDTGVVMRNSGSVAASSTTSVSTAHGLSRTPAWAQGTATINVGNFWNSVKNATNVGFTWSTSGSPTWHWEAHV